MCFGNTLIANQNHLSKSTGRSISVQVAGSLITMAQCANLESFVGRAQFFLLFLVDEGREDPNTI